MRTRVSSSAFTGPTDSVPASAATYAAGSDTLVIGNGSLTPGPTDNLGAQRIAMSYTGGTGNSQATWNPDLTIAIPLAAGLGSYSGTLTHSVS